MISAGSSHQLIRAVEIVYPLSNWQTLRARSPKIMRRTCAMLGLFLVTNQEPRTFSSAIVLVMYCS